MKINTENLPVAAIPNGHNQTLDSAISDNGVPHYGELYEIPARCGRAVVLQEGDLLTINNPKGTQVCDFWAFAHSNLSEFLSMEHLRTSLGRVNPKAGDDLVTNLRAPLIHFEADTSEGIHDTVIAACDLSRYQQLGVEEYHDNCTDNLRMALLAIGHHAPEVPSPFNIWMNVPIAQDGSFQWAAPVSKPADFVQLRALRPCIAVMSACPQDITQVNGEGTTPSSLTFSVEQA